MTALMGGGGVGVGSIRMREVVSQVGESSRWGSMVCGWVIGLFGSYVFRASGPVGPSNYVLWSLRYH